MRQDIRAAQCLMYVRYGSAQYHRWTLTIGMERSPNFSQRSSIVYSPTRAVINWPTHLTLQTQPIDHPVKTSQIHQSSPNALNHQRSPLSRRLTHAVDCGI